MKRFKKAVAHFKDDLETSNAIDFRLELLLAILFISAVAVMQSFSPSGIEGFAVKERDLSVESLSVGVQSPSEFQSVPVEAVVKYSGPASVPPKFDYAVKYFTVM